MAFSYPLTLVTAAAGYGKTTLVCNWIDSLKARQAGSAPLPVAWLSLDQGNSELTEFLRYFVAALQTVFADACAQTAELLHARRKPGLHHLATTLANDIGLLPSDFVLVLEDLHLIQGEAIYELLRLMVQHWPAPMHMIVITRRDPPLPVANLRATGRMLEIRGRDLRFTPEESAAYIRKVLPNLVDLPEVKTVERQAEGWIAGLQLGVLSLAAASGAERTMAALSAADVDLAGYLTDEVLAQQPPAIQSFLLQTSVLEYLSAPLCDAVIGQMEAGWNSGACLDWLERADLFVFVLGEEPTWYRLHALFREVLQRRAQKTLGADDVSELHRRAANWYAGKGLVDDGLRHALLAGDPEQAARLMEHGLRDVLNHEDRATLDRWLGMLPDEYIHQRPGLLMIKVWALELSWQLDAQSKLLGQVEEMLARGAGRYQSAMDEATLRGQVTGLSAQEAYLNGQFDLALERCKEALALLPGTWTYVRGAIVMYLAFSMLALGNGEAAERMLQEDYESLGNKGDSYAQRLLMALCFNSCLSGKLQQTVQVARVMLEQTTASQLSVLRGWAYYFLGVAHYQSNSLDTALRHLTELVEHSHTAQAASAMDAACCLALVHSTLGDHEMSREIVESLERMDVEQKGRVSDVTASLEAELFLRQGKVESAARWSEGFTAPVPEGPHLWFMHPHLTKVRILLARGLEGDAQAALRILEDVLAVAEGTCNVRIKIEVLILRALALDATGSSSEAVGQLREAVELARPGGLIRVFVDQGPRVRYLLTLLARRGVQPATVRRILDAFPVDKSSVSVDGRQIRFPGDSFPSQIDTPLAEPLTPREMDVLALLQEPLSTKEIGRMLSVSPGTVKRHTINIYAKLGVSSRRDAVARATALRLLTPH